MKTIKTITALFFVSLIGLNTAGAQDHPFEVEITGKGRPILFFPGFTCTKDVWKETINELSQQYECHAFTFAGFGGVTPIETPWLPKIKAGIETYIEEKELDNVVIIGHSLGATLGLWLASTETDSVEKLVVVEGLPATGALMIPGYKSENVGYDNPFNNQILQMSEEDFAAMADQYAVGMTLNTSKRKQIKDWIVQSDRKTYVYGYTDLLKLDLREAIANIKAELLVLGASHPFGSEAAKNTYETQFKNAPKHDLRIAENAAHFLMYDRPEWFMQQLHGFLSEVN